LFPRFQTLFLWLTIILYQTPTRPHDTRSILETHDCLQILEPLAVFPSQTTGRPQLAYPLLHLATTSVPQKQSSPNTHNRAGSALPRKQQHIQQQELDKYHLPHAQTGTQQVPPPHSSHARMAGMPRESSFMPTVKCSSCGLQVEISMMGEHLCTGPPEMPCTIHRALDAEITCTNAP